MWPADAFYLARKAQNFVYFACLLDRNTPWINENVLMSAFGHSVVIFMPAMRFELCSPGSKGLTSQFLDLDEQHLYSLKECFTFIFKLLIFFLCCFSSLYVNHLTNRGLEKNLDRKKTWLFTFLWFLFEFQVNLIAELLHEALLKEIET